MKSACDISHGQPVSSEQLSAVGHFSTRVEISKIIIQAFQLSRSFLHQVVRMYVCGVVCGCE